MTCDKEVQLTSAHPQSPGGFHPVAIALPEHAVEQQPFQHVKVGREFIRLQWQGTLPRGRKFFFRKLTQKFPPQQTIAQAPQIARAGQQSERRRQRCRAAFFLGQNRETAGNALGIFRQGGNPEDQAMGLGMNGRFPVSRQHSARVGQQPGLQRRPIQPLRIIQNGSSPTPGQFGRHRTRPTPTLTTYPDGLRPGQHGRKAPAPGSIARQPL